jgi:Zn-dependent M16 (insulinase) family peptidase
MCAESMIGVNIKNPSEYAPMLIMGELLTFNFLIPLIREKGGAYGAGCQVNESGTFSFYSYRDPKIE